MVRTADKGGGGGARHVENAVKKGRPWNCKKLECGYMEEGFFPLLAEGGKSHIFAVLFCVRKRKNAGHLKREGREGKKRKSEAHFCRIELLRTYYVLYIHVGWAYARTPEGNLVRHPPVPTPFPLSSLPYSRHICCHTWTYPSVPVNNNLLLGREGRRASEGGPSTSKFDSPPPPPPSVTSLLHK